MPRGAPGAWGEGSKGVRAARSARGWASRGQQPRDGGRRPSTLRPRRDQDALQIHARVQTGRTSGSPRLEVLCKRVTKQMKIGIPGVSGKDGPPVSPRSVFPSERAWTCSPLRDLCLTDVTWTNNSTVQHAREWHGRSRRTTVSHADGTVPKGRGACVGRVSGAALLCRARAHASRRRRGAGPARQVRGGGAGSRAQVLSAVSPGAERDPVLGAYALRVLAPPDRARRHFQVRRRGDHDAGRGSRRGAGAGGAPFCRKHRVGEEGALPRPAPDAGGGRGAHAPPLPRRARLAAAAHGLGRAAVPRMAPPPHPRTCSPPRPPRSGLYPPCSAPAPSSQERKSISQAGRGSAY